MMRTKGYRSGLAMVTALALMSLAVMAVTAMNSALFFEARRSRMLSEDAQLRQLLLAGAEIARNGFASHQGQWAIELPDPLKREGAELTATVESQSSPSEAVLEIDASIPGRRMSEKVHLAETGGTWNVVSADLGD
jgi:hypothetical protein